MAHDIYRNVHGSLRPRPRLPHVDAWADEYAPRPGGHGRPEVARVANAVSSNVIISSEGPSGSLRRELSDSSVPTITKRSATANRSRALIDSVHDWTPVSVGASGCLVTETLTASMASVVTSNAS